MNAIIDEIKWPPTRSGGLESWDSDDWVIRIHLILSNVIAVSNIIYINLLGCFDSLIQSVYIEVIQIFD